MSVVLYVREDDGDEGRVAAAIEAARANRGRLDVVAIAIEPPWLFRWTAHFMHISWHAERAAAIRRVEERARAVVARVPDDVPVTYRVDVDATDRAHGWPW